MKPDLNSPQAQFSIELIHHAAKLARQVRAESSCAPQAKEDHSPVTIADMAIQAIAGAMFGRYFPDAQLVAEESAEELRKPEGASRLQAVLRYVRPFIPEAGSGQICDWIDRGKGSPKGTFWVLDPIDGTKGYLRGGQYVTALALIRDGQVELAAIGCPELELPVFPELGKGVLLFAERERGCWAASLERENWVRVHVSPSRELSRARILDSYDPEHKSVEKNSFIKNKLGILIEPFPLDSQAKHVMLAAGCAEIFFRTLPKRNPAYREKIWDIAPGAFVIEEAGGRVTDLNGDPMDYRAGEILKNNPGFVATNGCFHDEILKAIREAISVLPK